MLRFVVYRSCMVLLYFWYMASYYRAFSCPLLCSRAFCSVILRLDTTSLPLCSFACNTYCGSTKRQKRYLCSLQDELYICFFVFFNVCCVKSVMCFMCSLGHSAGQAFYDISNTFDRSPFTPLLSGCCLAGVCSSDHFVKVVVSSP